MLKKISLILMTGFMCLVIMADKCPYKCPPDPAAQLNPEHAQFSPVASRIFLQLQTSDSCAEKGNVKLFVLYDALEYNKEVLAFMHEGKKAVLHDDGIYPDVKKGDQLYSTIINFDTAQLRQIYSSPELSLKAMKTAGEQPSYLSFNGREVTGSIVFTEEDRRINFDDFRKGKLVELLIEFPSLQSIRNNSLYIISPSVLEDPTRVWIPNNPASNPNGAWSFKKIVEGLANTAVTGVAAEDFVLNWLNTWKNGGTVNGDLISPRSTAMQDFITAWPRLASGKLDLTKSPFKLIAIVNRLDLMPNPIYNTEKKGGEMRFIFTLLQPVTPMNALGDADIIFEFGVNKTGDDLLQFAKKWYDLKNFAVGSTEYKNKLEELTNEIIKPNAEPGKPNGSNLNQLRTNELPVGGWQLREFVIKASSKQLVDTTVKQEPAEIFNNSSAVASLALLKKYVTDNEAKILKNQYNIPDKLADGTPFLGSKSNYPGIWGTHAGGEIINQKARFIFSLNTCGGCHLQVTNAPFLHNDFDGGTAFGKATLVSGFIKGSKPGLGTNDDHATVNDPNLGTHTFNDLARRAKILWGFANSHPTLFGLQFNPVNMEH